MFAAAVRVETSLKIKVRAVIAADDSPAVILEKLCAWSVRTATIRVFVRIPVRVRFEVDFFKTVGWIFPRAAMR